MTNEQMKEIIKYLIKIKFYSMDKAIDILLNEINSSSGLETLIDGLLKIKPPQNVKEFNK